MGFRIPAGKLDHELLLLWRREMVTDVYVPRWVTMRTAGGPISAIAFVVNRTHSAYAGRMAVADAARVIRAGEGSLGRSDAYVARTLEQLQYLGIRDRRLERIASLARSV
jgi:cation transport protein ChaC